MINVAGTAFSITLVALGLAAANFSPRLLRNFMRDTGNQFVLGTFIGTFIYCLLLLRTIQGDGDGYSFFVPQLCCYGGFSVSDRQHWSPDLLYRLHFHYHYRHRTLSWKLMSI